MPSPFPGMDPYLEDPAFWPDFHFTFIGCWREALAALLPEPYEARINERVNLVQMSPEVIQLIYPDIAVSRKPTPTQQPGGGAGTLLLEPVTIPNEFLEEVRETRIEILHRPERSLVGVLEMLSPTNKSGDGFQEYRAKRKAILLQRVHLVELDLLVGGNRIPLLESLPRGDYYTLVTRSETPAHCQVYAWTLRQPLPTIPIPLRAPDPDIQVDLGQVFRTAFERGRYFGSLPYGQPPITALQDQDKSWAVELSRKVPGS